MSMQELALQGKHNLYNSMAAGVAARILEINDADLRAGFTLLPQYGAPIGARL